MKATILNRKLFFLLFFSLLLFSACEDEFAKLPVGTKPEILIGKWKSEPSASYWHAFTKAVSTTYEFKTNGGYMIEDWFSTYDDSHISCDTVLFFTNWVYDGDAIWLQRKGREGTTLWTWAIKEITSDSVVLRGDKCYRIE